MKIFLNQLIKGCLLAALFFASCTSEEESNKRFKRISKGLEKQNELKRVTESQIISQAYKQGKLIAGSSQQELSRTLKKALTGGGIERAISFCNVKALPMTDSLARHYQANIKRTSLKLRNPKNAPNGLETQLLEAYTYTVEQGGEVNHNVQDLENGYLLYTKPIILDNALCLNCHGEVGKTLSESTHQLIQKLYPDDQATGFQKGELRGMWSITLDKAEVIRAIPVED